MLDLLKLRGFFAYLAIAFLNAFVDLGHKIVIQNTVFKVYDGPLQIALTAVVNALILLPFILLFSPAGYIADKYPKNRVMLVAAWLKVVMALAITWCYYNGWFWPAYALTFLMAVQSAIYSPAKYGYLKVLVGNERLGEGNGALQATTIVAILAGTFVYSILFEARFGHAAHPDKADILRAAAPLGWLLVANSVVEGTVALRLQSLEVTDRATRFPWRDYLGGRTLRASVAPALSHRLIRIAIFGLAVFWAVSQVMLAAFPAFAKDQLGQTSTVVVQGTLAASGIGIMFGSLLAGRFSRHHIETGSLPVGAFGIAAGLLWLPALHAEWLHIANFMFIGLMGGLFIVPLNAMIQFHAREVELGRVLASSNLFQNLAMLAFLVVTVLLAGDGYGAVAVLWLVALVALAGGAYTVARIPQSLLRLALALLTLRHYRLEVSGLDAIPERGPLRLAGVAPGPVDAALLQLASPRPIRFGPIDACGRRGGLLARLTARVAVGMAPDIAIQWVDEVQPGSGVGVATVHAMLSRERYGRGIGELVTVGFRVGDQNLSQNDCAGA